MGENQHYNNPVLNLSLNDRSKPGSQHDKVQVPLDSSLQASERPVNIVGSGTADTFPFS